MSRCDTDNGQRNLSTETGSASCSEQAVDIASHHVEDYVPECIAKALNYFAIKVRTKEFSVLSSLLATTATVATDFVVLKISPESDHHYIPALNLLSISYTGGGKTQAVEVCLS